MKTTTRLHRELSPLLACGLAAVFIGAAAPRASAQTPPQLDPSGSSYSIKVPYSRSELGSDSGLDQIYQRIKGAARRVCNAASEPSDPKKVRHFYECVDGAVAQAVKDIDSQTLTALHQRETEKQKRAG
jgi:UrcA family protein